MKKNIGLSINVLTLLFLFDAFCLFISLKLAIQIRLNVFDTPLFLGDLYEVEKYFWIIPIPLLIFFYEKIYFVRNDFWEDTKSILKALILSLLIVLAVLSLAKISDEYSRVLILIYFFLSTLLIPVSKRIVKRIIFSFDVFKVNVKVLAKNKNYQKIIEEIEKNWYLGFKHSDVDYSMIIISSKCFKTLELEALISTYSKEIKDIFVIPYMSHLDFSHTHIVNYSNIRLSAIHLENRLLSFKNVVLKKVFEFFLVLMILPFVLILHFFIIIFIKIDSKGSPIFRQIRLGKNLKQFKCYKYRTMFLDQEILKDYLINNPDEVEHYAKYHKYINDPRITKVGRFLRKTSLDEIPQFYNVLFGNMNFIGPRPYMLGEEEKIAEMKKELIFNVNPGITGLWQVSGRSTLSFEERTELDIWYIQNWSLWIDFVIFLKTIKVVLFKVGAK